MNATATQTQPGKKYVDNLLTKLRTHPRISIAVASAALVAVGIALVLWAKQPDFRVLFSNVTSKDGGAIVTQLTQMNVAWHLDENSGTISVPADRVAELRMRLAQQGLPEGGNVGFELLDREKFGISQFSEQVNYQRALEGELARTIETLGPVKNARVHLAMPKPTLFVREQKNPSASVTLTLQPGRVLDEGQTSAIIHMVSGSVAGMPAGNVTVVDQSGHLLTKSTTGDRDLNDAQLKYTAEVEARYRQRIESILSPLTGNGNVHAQVAAQLNFAASEQTSEQYKPNSSPADQAVRSRQSSDNQQTGGLYPGGVPGALSNQPAPANTAPITTPDSNRPRDANGNNLTNNVSVTPSSSSKENTINYEVDRTIRHTRQNVGDVQRLSVAVVVNYRNDASGKPVALSNAQLKQIEELTREAMGFNPGRGDTLSVVNSPFSQSDESGDNLPFWQQPGLTEQLLAGGRWLLVLLVIWLLYRKLLRPLLMQQARQQQQTSQQQAEMAEKAAAIVTQSQEELRQEHESQYRMSAGAISQRIREISENDPRVVALVIRDWMKDEL